MAQLGPTTIYGSIDITGEIKGDGSSLTGIVAGGPSLGTLSIIRTNAITIDEDITMPANTNGTTAGPITISDGYTVTIEDGSTWTIL